MWLYLQVKKTYPNQRTSLEATEHSIRIDENVINKTELYGRKIILDGHEYEFDRFGLTGEPVFVRNEKSVTG